MRQFAFEPVAEVELSRGFITRFQRDPATDSIPQ
jgi:hypothetical protein